MYRWLADGTKAKLDGRNGFPSFYYLGSLVYKRTPRSATEFESTGFGGGRIVKTSDGYEINYHLTDHLGSVRVVFAPSSTGHEIVERNDYYPFGGRHWNPQLATSSKNRIRFAGKEDQTATATFAMPYLDFGARMYDVKLPIWTAHDPLGEDDSS